MRPRGSEPADPDCLAQQGERQGEVDTSPAQRLRERDDDALCVLHG